MCLVYVRSAAVLYSSCRLFAIRCLKKVEEEDKEVVLKKEKKVFTSGDYKTAVGKLGKTPPMLRLVHHTMVLGRDERTEGAGVTSSSTVSSS